MSQLKCPKCGAMFHESYKSCPFCAEDDAYFGDGGKEPTTTKPRSRGKKGSRLEGHDKGLNILGPTLIVVLLLLAAILVYAFFGDKISAFIHRDDTKPVEGTLTVEPVEAELTVGEIRSLTASGVETVTWSSSDETVAKVDENGAVTAVGAGTAVITATDESSKLTARCGVTVKAGESQTVDPTPTPTPTPDPPPDPTPTIDLKDLAIGATIRGGALDKSGDQYDMTLNSGTVHLVVLEKGKETTAKVTWSSSDTSKVTVDAEGVVTRKASGQVIVTAEVGGQKLECLVRG